MATTSPWNITLFDDNSAFTPVQTPFNTLAQNLNDALTSGGYQQYATKAALVAAPGTRAGQHATVYADPTPALNRDYVWNGSAWVFQSPIEWVTEAPYSIGASGITTVPFPAGTFSKAPNVQAVVVTAANGVVSFPWLGSPATTTGVGVRIFSLGGAQISGAAHVHATQMAP